MSNRNPRFWIVVDVRSGIPSSVSAFNDEKVARRRQKELQAQTNPEDDEIGLFFVQVDNEPHVSH